MSGRKNAANEIRARLKPAHTTSISEPVQLRRSLSLPLITFYGIGTIVGAGIYVLIGEVAGLAGMYAPVAFLLAAFIAGFSAFSYAELSARHPRSAGEAVYVDEAFHRPLLSVLTGWAVVLVGVVSAATIANGFVGYLHLFVQVPGKLAISGLVIALGLLAIWGISESVWVAAVITVLELLGLLMVLVLAGDGLAALPQRWSELIPPSETPPWIGIVFGAFLAFYAFIGFEDMVNVAEEVKNPQRTLPLAIILALFITTAFYILIALTAVLGLSPDALSQSKAPLATLIEKVGGYSPVSIGLISLIAVVNGALIQIIMASRVVYGMARQQAAPATFAVVNPKTRTPIRATVLIMSAVLILALWLPLVRLATITSFITLMVFALINLSLWRLKTRAPHPPGVLRNPLWVPITGFLLCAGFLLLQILR
jgi:APA family basic amino acid/polyamine antiporter